MVRGQTITEIARRLKYVKDNSCDYVVHTDAMRMNNDKTFSIKGNGGTITVTPTRHAHSQLATHNEIPWAYYQRCLDEEPELLASQVNTWLSHHGGNERRMLRTVKDLNGNGNLRAYLSNSYARRDAFDLMNHLYPIMTKNNMQFISAELTESRLYIKATHPNMRGQVKVGDVVEGGVIISTSDVGAGALRVEPYALRLLCTNGMVSRAALKQRHLGKRQGEDSIMEILSDEAHEADDKAFFLKARDVLIDALKPESFEKIISQYQDAAQRAIGNANLPHVVELTAKRVGLTNKGMKEDIVKQLLTGNEGAGLTQWGLANSFTALAKNEKVDYDTSVELERAGGEIAALTESEWNRIAA